MIALNLLPETHRRRSARVLTCDTDALPAELGLLRESLSLTQKQLARELGICPSTVCHFEGMPGEAVTVGMLQRYAAALGLEVVVTVRKAVRA